MYYASHWRASDSLSLHRHLAARHFWSICTQRTFPLRGFDKERFNWGKKVRILISKSIIILYKQKRVWNIVKECRNISALQFILIHVQINKLSSAVAGSVYPGMIITILWIYFHRSLFWRVWLMKVSFGLGDGLVPNKVNDCDIC